MKPAANWWRESASLIVLARNNEKCGHNFDILSFKRPAKASFMANSSVFPGGATEAEDESKEWIKHFQKFGIANSRLDEITKVHGKRPTIFDSTADKLKKEISLRITAIRETFEELGVLVCRRKDQVDIDSDFGHFFEDFNRKKWQRKVHNDPKAFFKLCQMLEVIPDVWGLHEWSAWLTPTYISKRFQTAFFLVAFDQKPSLISEESEVTTPIWKTPSEMMELFKTLALFLPPPQLYEISRLKTMDDIDNLARFARKRGSLGIDLFFPIHCKCKDGMVYLFPGDDLYPEIPDFYALQQSNLEKFAEKTIEEARQGLKNLHRIENRSLFDIRFSMTIDANYGHLNPHVRNIRSNL